MTRNVNKLVRYTNLHPRVRVKGAYGFRVDNLKVPTRPAITPKTLPSRKSTVTRRPATKAPQFNTMLNRAMPTQVQPVQIKTTTTTTTTTTSPFVCTPKGELLFTSDNYVPLSVSHE